MTLKSWRAKWEGIFRGALPKQMMPYLSLRHNIVIGNPGGLKEAALLAKAWGVTNPIIVNTSGSRPVLLLRSGAHGPGRGSAGGRAVTVSS